MKVTFLPGNVVRTFERRWAGIIVVEFPSNNGAVFSRPTAHVDDTARPEIGPCEFLFACPGDFHRLSGGFGQASSFDGRLSGMLAAITRTSIGNDDADIPGIQIEGLCDFFADTERALAPRPHGDLIAIPLGYGGARL